MDKKHKQHLIVTLIFALIVSATLFFMYDDFTFQTYGEVVYYDYIVSGENNQVKLENVEVYCDQKNFRIGDGRILFKDNSFIGENQPIIKIKLYGESKQSLNYDFELSDYRSDNLVYSFIDMNKKTKKVNLNDLSSAELVIEVNGQEVNQLDLKIKPLEQLEGSNKDYRIENASISHLMMRLGSLKSVSTEIINEYPTVSLEYRYLKDNDGDVNDNDNYVVFKKITGTSKELVNSKDYGTYNLEDEEDNFKNKVLSVVIIFSNDKDKFAFSIDLKKREVGDYYG